MVDPVALREAVLNALLHNDYSYGGTPKIEWFSDRVEIVSCSGLPAGLTREGLLAGRSVPRNKELMRVFRDLGLVESLGSGVRRILRAYPEKGGLKQGGQKKGRQIGAGGRQNRSGIERRDFALEGVCLRIRMAEMFALENSLTTTELANRLGISRAAVSKHLVRLKRAGILRRIGPDRGGHWEVRQPAESRK